MGFCSYLTMATALITISHLKVLPNEKPFLSGQCLVSKFGSSGDREADGTLAQRIRSESVLPRHIHGIRLQCRPPGKKAVKQCVNFPLVSHAGGASVPSLEEKLRLILLQPSLPGGRVRMSQPQTLKPVAVIICAQPPNELFQAILNSCWQSTLISYGPRWPFRLKNHRSEWMFLK